VQPISSITNFAEKKIVSSVNELQEQKGLKDFQGRAAAQAVRYWLLAADDLEGFYLLGYNNL
jgi:hypothetical protein